MKRIIDGELADIPQDEADALQAEWDTQNLEAAVTKKVVELEQAYADATENGFTSSALGVSHEYKSHGVAQLDLIGLKSCNRARKVWCSDGVDWAMRMHTAAQIETVINDGADIKEAAFENMVTKQLLVQSIAQGAGTAAEKIAAIQAISW